MKLRKAIFFCTALVLSFFVANAQPSALGNVSIEGDGLNASTEKVYTNTRNVNVTLRFNHWDNVNKVALGNTKEECINSNNWKSLDVYPKTIPWTLSSGDGTKTVYAKFWKQPPGSNGWVIWADGVTNKPYEDSIILDTVKPADPVIEVVSYNSGSTTVRINYPSDASIKQYMLDDSLPKNYTGNFNINYNGVRVTAFAQDTAGNSSNSVYKTITVNGSNDITPPTGTISINSGSDQTNSQNVYLILSASDIGGTVTQMAVSNSPSFSDSRWEPFATYKSWTLTSEPGLKSVFVKFMDSSSNISSVYGDTIQLISNSRPSVPQFNLQSGQYYGTQSLTMASTSGASIYYTTDGSEPNQYSSIYNGVIYIGSSVNLRAKAYKDGVWSDTAVLNITILQQASVPSAPTGLTSSVTNTQVNLTWNSVSTANGYYIYRNDVRVATTTGTSYTDCVSAGSTYNYYIIAYNAYGNSNPSNVISVTVQQAVPSAPTGFTYNLTNNQVYLSWNSVSGANGYQLYKNGVQLVATTGTSYADSIATGTTNNYYVIAYNTRGNSNPSNTITVTAQQTVPSAPTGLTYNLANNQVNLVWNSVTGSTGYIVYKNSIQVGTTSGTSYTDTISTGTTNNYYVVAYNSSGNSNPSNTITVTAQQTVPCAPTGLTYTSTNNQVNLVWNNVTGATGYIVYKNSTQIGTTSGTSYTDTISTGTTNNYYVVAYNSSGNSNPSNTITVTTQQPGLNAPTGLTYNISNTQINLTWNSVTGAIGYYVYKNGYITGTANTTSYTEYVYSGTTYNYYVVAYNASGISSPSNTITASVQTVPNAPTGLTYTISNNQVNLTWSSVTGATGYYVYKNGYMSGTANTTNYTEYIYAGTNYSYYVVAYNASGISSASNTISVNSQTTPNAPTGLTYSISNNQVYLSWSSVTGATGYYVYKNGTQIGTANTTSYTDYMYTGSGTTNTYYVVAYNASGSSSPSNTITVNAQNQTLPTPTNLTYYINGTNQIILTWGASAGAVDYYIYRNGSQVGTVTSNSYTDYIAVNNYTTYTYYVVAHNSYGTSTPSNIVTINSTNNNDDRNALLTQAKEQYRNGRYDEAISTLNRLLAIDRNIEDAMLLYADCYIKKNDLTAAKSKLQEYMAIYEYPRIINKYAEVCIKRGEYQEARQKLISILPKYAGETYLYKTLASAYERLNITGIRVFVYGTEVDFSRYDNVRPYLAEGRTLIPIRALSESLGAQVDWNSYIGKATIRLDNKTLEITNGLRTAKVNGVSMNLDVPAQMENGRLMVPLRFVSENFGKSVDWYAVESVVNIISITNQ